MLVLRKSNNIMHAYIKTKSCNIFRQRVNNYISDTDAKGSLYVKYARNTVGHEQVLSLKYLFLL